MKVHSSYEIKMLGWLYNESSLIMWYLMPVNLHTKRGLTFPMISEHLVNFHTDFTFLLMSGTRLAFIESSPLLFSHDIRTLGFHTNKDQHSFDFRTPLAFRDNFFLWYRNTHLGYTQRELTHLVIVKHLLIHTQRTDTAYDVRTPECFPCDKKKKHLNFNPIKSEGLDRY